MPLVTFIRMVGLICVLALMVGSRLLLSVTETDEGLNRPTEFRPEIDASQPIIPNLQTHVYATLRSDEDSSWWWLEGDIEQRALHREWNDIGRAHKDESLELIFAVKQTNTEALERFVKKTSDPHSPSYGEYMTLDTVNQLLKPMQISVDSILDHLKRFGVEHEKVCDGTANSDFIRCLVSVQAAEALLKTEYRYYRHALRSDLVVMRTKTYALPRRISEHVDFVSPTVRFPAVRLLKRQPRRVSAAPLSTKSSQRAIGNVVQNSHDQMHRDSKRETGKDTGFLHEDYPGINTPDSLRKLYAVEAHHHDHFHIHDTQNGSHNTSSKMADWNDGKQACTGFLEQYFERKDIQRFYDKFYPEANGREDGIRIIGPDKSHAGVEATLDIEYLTTLGNRIQTEFWSFKGRAPDNPENEPFLKWMMKMSNTSDSVIPKVFSTSYGEAEHTVSRAYMERINNEFKKAAARGISILFATGDYGVSDQGMCPEGRFQGQWPASSPWVTSVGGTQHTHPFMFPDSPKDGQEHHHHHHHRIRHHHNHTHNHTTEGIRNTPMISVNPTANINPANTNPNLNPNPDPIPKSGINSPSTDVGSGDSENGTGERHRLYIEGHREETWAGSAGGFSDRFPRPAYQAKAVDEYLKRILSFPTTSSSKLSSTSRPYSVPDSRRFNKSGAGFPDVAAQARDFLVVVRGSEELVDGTSCACPTFAGIVSLLNSYRLKSNKSSLGFLNPLFYEFPEMFNDITKGTMIEGGKMCGEHRYRATQVL